MATYRTRKGIHTTRSAVWILLGLVLLVGIALGLYLEGR